MLTEKDFYRRAARHAPARLDGRGQARTRRSSSAEENYSRRTASSLLASAVVNDKMGARDRHSGVFSKQFSPA